LGERSALHCAREGEFGASIRESARFSRLFKNQFAFGSGRTNGQQTERNGKSKRADREHRHQHHISALMSHIHQEVIGD